MKSLAKIFFYLLASLFIGALVAPFIYQAIEAVPASRFGPASSFLLSLQKMPFHRYLSRPIQITTLLLLWPTIRWLRIRHFSEFSLYKNPMWRSDFFFGIVAALLPLWMLQLFFLWKGWYLWNFTITLGSLFKLVLTAAVVSLFEEFFFRGILLGLSRHFLKDRSALLWNAFLFAGVHFLNTPHQAIVEVHWWSGLAACTDVGHGLPPLPLLFGSFASLMALGIILGWVTVRTGSLWLAIGLHAAWIFGQQFFNSIAHYAITPANGLLPWIGASQIYGMVPVGLVVFLPMGATVFFLTHLMHTRVPRTKES